MRHGIDPMLGNHAPPGHPPQSRPAGAIGESGFEVALESSGIETRPARVSITRCRHTDILSPSQELSMIPKSELRVEIDDEGPSALAPAVAYAAIRTLAKLLTQLAPMSAFTALLTTLLWLAAAIYLFVVLTWMRDDNWLGAGLIIGATLFCGGTIAELVGRMVQPGPLGELVFATGSAILGLLIRSVILVPLAGGAVFGARWLTEELRRSDVLS